jgi:hypothetical protein
MSEEGREQPPTPSAGGPVARSGDPPGRAFEAPSERASGPPAGGLVAVWYAPLLGGLLPVLLLGFGYSALADRLVFVYWALALGSAWVVLLRHGVGAGWEAPRRAGALALLLALGFGGFAALAKRHGEDLDLGFRAVLPGLYHPVATRPGTFAALAAALALAGVAGFATLWLRRRAR